MLQHDAPPSPYMARHQGASPDSPYLSRNINQRSVGQHTEVSSHSNVSRHASQRSVSAPNKNYSQTDVYHYDEYQAPSATSTLNRQSHYPLPSAQPSATSTLLRQSHDHPRTHPNEPPSATSTLIRRQHHPATHPNEPPSATSTLTRGQQYSQGSPHQNTSQFYGSQTSVNQRPLYTRQDSEPPPPYLTHSRQPSRSYDNHDTDQNINREHSYPQQSEERQHSQSVSRSQSRLSHQQDQRITPKLTRNESERSLARTQQSGYSQHSRASSLSNSHPIPDGRYSTHNLILIWNKSLIEAIVKGDPKKGELAAKKAKCYKCHGDTGVSDEDDTPSIAGQIAAYTFKQLYDYKLKLRDDKDMYKKVKKLSDQEMIDISAWYATL